MLIVVLVLAAGILVSWAVTSRPSTSGQAVRAPAIVDATSGLAPGTSRAPAVPAKLVAKVDHNAVRLTWQRIPGDRRSVPQYVVFRDGGKVGAVKGVTTFRDTKARPGHKYAYQVQAVNESGLGSPLSPKVSIAMPGSAGSTLRSSAAGGPTSTDAAAMPGSWPSAASTGSSGALGSASGEVTLSTTGQVYQNMRVKGTITVTACNVTIRNVEVDTGEPFTGDNTKDLFAIWLQESESCGVTIDHVSTITESAPNVYVTTSIRVARGGPVTITNSKMIGAQLGILGVSTGKVQGNYIELGKNMRGDHNDAIQGDGSSNLTIDHNTLLNPNDQTSALALYTEYGNNTNDMVSDNLFAGGGYACYCGDGKSDNNGKAARSNNVSFMNNVFWRKYYPDSGYFGAGRAFNPAGGGKWSGNVYMNADGTLTTQQVPQPAIDQ